MKKVESDHFLRGVLWKDVKHGHKLQQIKVKIDVRKNIFPIRGNCHH